MSDHLPPGVYCKGDYSLGTACGQCDRCDRSRAERGIPNGWQGKWPLAEPTLVAHEGWRPTFKAEITLQPVHFVGGDRECLAWCNSLAGQIITVTAKDGTVHTVGVVTGYKSERVP